MCYSEPAERQNMALITSHADAAMAANATEVACEVRAYEARSISADFPPVELTLRDREAYFNAVLNPPAPNARLREAARRYISLKNR
jgi:hypothetical protein